MQKRNSSTTNDGLEPIFFGFYLKDDVINKATGDAFQKRMHEILTTRRPTTPDAITLEGNVSFDLESNDPVRLKVIAVMRSVASKPYTLGTVRRCVVTAYSANHNRLAPVTAMTLHKDGSSSKITTAVLTLGTFSGGGVDVANTWNGRLNTKRTATWRRVTPKSRSLYWFPGGIIEHRGLAVLSGTRYAVVVFFDDALSGTDDDDDNMILWQNDPRKKHVCPKCVRSDNSWPTISVSENALRRHIASVHGQLAKA